MNAKKWMARAALAVGALTLIGTTTVATSASATATSLPRTYATTRYAADPQSLPKPDMRQRFSFPAIDGYDDPGLTLHPSVLNPLYDPRFRSYEVIVKINREPIVRNGDVVHPGPTMRVYNRRLGGLVYHWRVSTASAARGKVTPAGYFTVEGFSSGHRSSLYDLFPMNWAVFFQGHFAVHAVPGHYADTLGHNVSAGCVRLEWQRARALFHMVGASGRGAVADIHRQTGAVRLGKNGQPLTKTAYRTLIVIE